MLSLILFTLSAALDLERIVNEVNTRNDVTWTASVNPRFAALTKLEWRSMNRARRLPENLRHYKPITIRNDIPEEFDSTQYWSQCETVGTIFDQGHCGSCWAMATFESLQDRFCIASNGTVAPRLSGQYLTSCCTGSSGCNGGWTESAFSFAKSTGLCTEKCVPYQMGTCKHPGCDNWSTPKCNRTCYPDTTIPVSAEKYYAKSYSSIAKKEEAIQTEIMTYGPVTACMSVYEDFATYTSGVYHHVTGSYDGGHAVKVVGWGVLNGVKYWKVANSWNTDWGMDGYFLIQRGNNECGIEQEIVSGTPKL